ncbi:tyrosine-type recombinase/integrase [Alsobacter sp. R-9]
MRPISKRSTNPVDSVAKRRVLKPNKNPLWTRVGRVRGGLSLGYRKPVRGPGSWCAKLVFNKARFEARLAQADDDGHEPGALDYEGALAAAIEWSRRMQAEAAARAVAKGQAAALTVRSAVETHTDALVAERGQHGRIAKGRLALHVLSDDDFAALPLAELDVAAFEGWRNRRLSGQPAATANRILNDLRAALNRAARRHAKRLPADLPAVIREGAIRLPVAKVEAARTQVMTEADLRAVLKAALEIDPDFGAMVAVLAATGARWSQAAKLRVRDLMVDKLRILMPRSSKGRAGGEKAGAIPWPLGKDVVDVIRPLTTGRRGHESLLTRWSYRRGERLSWIKDKRVPWGAASDARDLWAQVLAKAGVDQTLTMYALRHTRAVELIRAGVPIRVVADALDTSVEMIEAHYSFAIVNKSEDLLRAVLTPLAPTVPAPLKAVS